MTPVAAKNVWSEFDEVAHGDDLIEVEALVPGELPLAVVARPQLALDLAAERRHGACRGHRLGGAADAEEDVDAAVALGGCDRTGDVAVADQGDAGARGSHLAHVVVVAGPVEDHGGQIR